MQVLITLSSYGDAVGPFDIYYGYYAPASETLVIGNIDIDTLALGYIVNSPDDISYIRVENLDIYGGNNQYVYFAPPSPTPSVSITP